MKQIKIHDKTFRLYISYEQITSVVENMAEKMNLDLAGKTRCLSVFSMAPLCLQPSCLSA